MGVSRYESFIGWRYLFRRRRSRPVMLLTLGSCALMVGMLAVFFGLHPTFWSAIASIVTTLAFIVFLLLNVFSVFTTVSIIGVVLGVAALSVVSSVTSGFQQSFKQKVLGVNAHVLVLKYGLDFSEYHEVMKKAEAEPHVKATAPFVFNEMMLSHGPALSGVLIKGIDPQLAPRVIDIGEKLTAGKFADLAERVAPNGDGPPLPAMFIGKELAHKIKVKLGDRLRVVSPKASFDPAAWNAQKGDAPTVHEFRVAGIFYSGFDEYDRRLVYVSLRDAQELVGAGDVVMGVEIKIDDIERAEDVAKKLLVDLGGTPYHVIDWEELNHNLFTALKLQKVAMVIFLTLIVIVAAFNIVAALTMLVIDKTKEVAIFKAMGMRSAGVARIFQVAGLTIGGVGVVGGIAVGLLFCKVIERYGYGLDPKVYLIDKLPVEIRTSEIFLVAGITMVICLCATIYPALKAARTRPVDGLRYE